MGGLVGGVVVGGGGVWWGLVAVFVGGPCPATKVSAVGHLNFRSFGLKMHLFGKARAEHHVHQWVLLGGWDGGGRASLGPFWGIRGLLLHPNERASRLGGFPVAGGGGWWGLVAVFVGEQAFLDSFCL